MEKVYLDGTLVYLAEVEERYLPYIIAWRNDPENNRYLNQPFVLTMEKQQAWYETYLTDSTQGLLIVVDKKNDTPFATMGWTDYNSAARICITGRLLVGDRRYRGSLHFIEASLLFADMVYNAFGVDVCYAHIVNANTPSVRYHEKYGFRRNEGNARFPDELNVNGLPQMEYVRTREDWLAVRESVRQKILSSSQRVTEFINAV